MEGATLVALLTFQQAVEQPSGAPTYSAVSASDTVVWDDGLMLIVKNGGGSADTVTIVVPGTGPGGVAIPDFTVSVPATTGERWIFIGNPAVMDPATGLVTITHSFTTSVTCAVVRIS
jgi:hypothetical protein